MRDSSLSTTSVSVSVCLCLCVRDSLSFIISKCWGGEGEGEMLQYVVVR